MCGNAAAVRKGARMKAVKSVLAGVQSGLSGWSLPSMPTLGRTVEIPVYVVHNSDKVEDYFFIFDFEEFVERSGEGIFVRPKLKVWAGRDDFDRSAFARQFREGFAAEFEAARAALTVGQQKKGGWFTWLDVLNNEVAGVAALFVANVILLVALSAGRLVLSAVVPRGLLKGKSEAAKLEDSIEATKGKVDEALARIEVVLHRDLAVHAFYGELPEAMEEVTFDDWPLPEFVSRHLEKG